MQKIPGDAVDNFSLPALDGGEFELASLAGRPYLLAFFRFAACPFCNLRMHELASRHAELAQPFGVVAVFDSPPDNLRRFAARHRAPFPVLADENGAVHARYGVERSLARTLKGAVTRLPAVVDGLLFKGYWPTAFKGSLITMPADLLVDAEGIVRRAHYGRDEGDHLPFDEVRHFATVAVSGSIPR